MKYPYISNGVGIKLETCFIEGLPILKKCLRNKELITKIDNEAIKKLYNHYLEDISDKSRDQCPSPKILLKSIRQNLSTKKNGKIIRHMSKCIHCSKEFELLQKIVREEKNIETRIGQALNTNYIEAKVSQRKPVGFPPIKTKYVVIATTLSIVIFVSLYIFKFQNQYQYRRARASPLQIEYPRDSRLLKSRLYFRWNNISEIEYYVIQIFDDTLISIWKSPKIKDNVFIPSKALLASFQKNTRYFWMVTAYDSKGKGIESRLEDFVIKR